MKIALVYDWVNKFGGAERVLEALHEIYPNAPLYTSVYNPNSALWALKFKVKPSFLNKFPLAKNHHEFYPFLTPLAFESFDFSDFDLVISVTSAHAKGILTLPSTCHICYCLTPTRYLYSGFKDYFKNKSFLFLSRPFLKYLKSWDKVASCRPDFYFSISENVKKRIKKYYLKDSEIVYPPVDIDKFFIKDNKVSDCFLVVSRLVNYKKVDLVIRVFNKLGWPLKIVGEGRQMTKLKALAKKNIEFLGRLTDNKLVGYYQNCRAVIFPQEEDFGLVPLEAQACGKSVLAFKGGGALETIIDGRTGTFFYPQTQRALVKALKKFKVKSFSPEACRRNAEIFSKDNFKKNFKQAVKSKYKKWQK